MVSFADVVVARYSAHGAQVLEDRAVQVSNVMMMEDTPSIALTEFVRNGSCLGDIVMQFFWHLGWYP